MSLACEPGGTTASFFCGTRWLHPVSNSSVAVLALTLTWGPRKRNLFTAVTRTAQRTDLDVN